MPSRRSARNSVRRDRARRRARRRSSRTGRARRCGPKRCLIARSRRRAWWRSPSNAQHRVDDVLEQARPGEGAVLGDVADEHDGDVAALGLDDELLGALAHLGDRAGRATRRARRRSSGCCRPRTSSGVMSSIAATTPAQRRLGGDPQRRSTAAPRRSARPLHLLGALLGADVERRRRPPGEQLQQQRALADARLAAEQRDRPGDEARRRAPGRARRCPSAAARRASRRRRRDGRPERAGAASGRRSPASAAATVSSTSVFHAPHPAHCPDHLGCGVPHSTHASTVRDVPTVLMAAS